METPAAEPKKVQPPKRSQGKALVRGALARDLARRMRKTAGEKRPRKGSGKGKKGSVKKGFEKGRHRKGSGKKGSSKKRTCQNAKKNGSGKGKQSDPPLDGLAESAVNPGAASDAASVKVPAPWPDPESERSRAGAIVASPQLLPPIPKCRRCAAPMNNMKFQITGKKAGSFKCATCNVKDVQLNRMFGGWPTQQFDGLPDTEKEDFYKKAAVCSTALELKVVCDQTWRKSRTEGRERQLAGELLPLSVWASRGFDPEKIKADALPSEDEEVRMLGTCYRVKVDTQIDFTKEEEERREEVKKSQRIPTVGSKASASGGKKKKKRSSMSSRSSSRSRSRSSSSSSDGKKQRAKKAKMDKKG